MSNDIYQEFSLFYDDFTGRYVSGTPIFFEIPLQFFGYTYDKDAGPLLDLGCGTGDLAIYYAEQGFEVTGVDLSESMLKVARAKLSRKNLKNIRFLQQDIVELDLEPGFAYIHSKSTFFHLNPEQLRKVFKNCWRLLKPEGILMFEVITTYGLQESCNGISRRHTNHIFNSKGIFNSLDNTGVLNYEFIFDDGRSYTVSLTVNGYNIRDVIPLLAEAGFRNVRAFDFSKPFVFKEGVPEVVPPSVLSETTPAMMVCAKKDQQS